MWGYTVIFLFFSIQGTNAQTSIVVAQTEGAVPRPGEISYPTLTEPGYPRPKEIVYPENHMCLSVIAILCCCWPFGLAAIGNSRKVCLILKYISVYVCLLILC